jgi:Cu/Zn superoxide dismutase
VVGFIARGIKLRGGPTALLGGAGTALVVSAVADDGKSEDSGPRLACGVVTKR